MAYSIQRVTSDGTLDDVDLTIDYIARTDIHVYVNDAEMDMVGGATPYLWNWINDTRISITPVVPLGAVVMIKRITFQEAPYHIFNAGAVFSEASMDENFLQDLYLAQEAKEGNATEDIYNDINMHGYKITNHGPAVAADDVITLGQYEADAEGAYQNRLAADAAKVAAQASQTAAAASASTANTKANEASVSAANSQNSATSSANFANTSSIKADEATASATAAGISETNALNSANAASASEVAAELAETNAEAAELKAEAWADNPEDVPVEVGKYSAKHWAEKAADLVSAGGVASVFSRTGIVEAQSGDYSAAQISGLGTAATANTQTSSTDTTAGALMAVGAFGLGMLAAPPTPVDVNDTTLPTGLYRINTADAAQRPPGSINSGVMFVERFSATVVRQTWGEAGTAAGVRRMWYRTSYAANTWDAWQEVITGVKQTSLTDTTAGALMAVGAFGLGGNAPAVPSNDCDLIEVTGVYGIASGTINVPVGAISGAQLLHMSYNSGPTSSEGQLVINRSSAVQRMWFRSKAAGVWQPWAEVVTGVKQTSATDTTAGALMTVGAFGVGLPIPTTNLNTLTGTGLFSCGDVTGTPAVSLLGWWVYQIDAGAGAWKNQTAIAQGAPQIQYVRSSGDGVTWTLWRQVAIQDGNPSFTNTIEKFTDKGSLTGTVTINPLVDGGDVVFTMTGNTTVAFTTSGIPLNQSVVCSVQVKGAFAVTWPAGIIWPSGGVPAYQNNSVFTFQMRNFGGTIQIYGFLSGKGMAPV